ncbi:MAG TPA: type II toxin-antitoxin system VapC family toxin [Longimicrobium sp.]
MVFWDTSALVKAYTVEPGTPTVQAALQALVRRSSVTPFVALETLTVLSKLLRSGTFSAADYNRARLEFHRDYPRRFVRLGVRRHVRSHALSLAEKHRKAGVGALDILHLACALDVKARAHPRPAVFAVADGPLRRIATLEGVRTFDPEAQSVSDLMRALR